MKHGLNILKEQKINRRKIIMDGLVKTLGILLLLLGVALWAVVIFLIPAALVKFCWLYLFA